MTTLSYKAVKDALVAILQGVTQIKVVYDGERPKLDKFPAACVSAKSHTATLHDTVSNSKTYQHFIRIYFQTNSTTDADYEDVLEQVADAAIAALESNLTLSGTCDWSLPTSGEWRSSPTAKEVPVKYIELVVTSRARVVR